MKLRLFNAKVLAKELAGHHVPTDLQAKYLLVSFLMFTAAYYSGLVEVSAPLWTLPSIFEALAIGAVTILGISSAFKAGGGSANKSFIVDFSCLYVPVSITSMLVVWGVYWGIRFAFHGALVRLTEYDWQIAKNLAQIGTDFFGLLTFTAIVAVQIATYFRITNHMRAIRRLRDDA